MKRSLKVQILDYLIDFTIIFDKIVEIDINRIIDTIDTISKILCKVVFASFFSSIKFLLISFKVFSEDEATFSHIN